MSKVAGREERRKQAREQERSRRRPHGRRRRLAVVLAPNLFEPLCQARLHLRETSSRRNAGEVWQLLRELDEMGHDCVEVRHGERLHPREHLKVAQENVVKDLELAAVLLSQRDCSARTDAMNRSCEGLGRLPADDDFESLPGWWSLQCERQTVLLVERSRSLGSLVALLICSSGSRGGCGGGAILFVLLLLVLLLIVLLLIVLFLVCIALLDVSDVSLCFRAAIAHLRRSCHATLFPASSQLCSVLRLLLLARVVVFVFTTLTLLSARPLLVVTLLVLVVVVVVTVVILVRARSSERDFSWVFAEAD
mmetsp:Transcript_22682/g.73779  ORF Transcript_22682/g.73779 Transcript_22682/m.73779 type:complete len:308 (+) Transcript_22682:1084-2007(+)